MMKPIKLPELLAPAGGERQLRAAVRFGADAVYLGANRFGMRAHAGNFDEDMLKRAVAWCHERGVRVFLTLNIFAYDEDIAPIVDLAQYAVRGCGVDALIMADPGAIAAVMDSVPEAEIHLSTQMSTMNTRAIRFWYDQGIRRIVLSREVSLERIQAMRALIPADCQLEAFVHGAVCMSYSGRCTLSKYMTGRDANRGDCAQACRWRYRLEEQKRPGEYLPVEETDEGVHIFSAGDMNLLPHLDKLCAAGLDSLKIEGRMKNEYYVATVVGAYRQALNAIARGEFDDEVRTRLNDELLKISHRPYDTGFYFGAPEHPGDRDEFTQNRELAARVLSWENGRAVIEVKNKIMSGDLLELMTPGAVSGFELAAMTRADGTVTDVCPQPGSIVTIDLPHACEEGDLIRGTCRNHKTGT